MYLFCIILYLYILFISLLLNYNTNNYVCLKKYIQTLNYSDKKHRKPKHLTINIYIIYQSDYTYKFKAVLSCFIMIIINKILNKPRNITEVIFLTMIYFCINNSNIASVKIYI